MDYDEYIENKKNMKPSKRKRRKIANTADLPLSQTAFEQLLVELIIDGMLPISIVSLEAFKRYTNGITTGSVEPPVDTPKFRIISSKTVNSRIDEMYETEMEKLRCDLGKTKYLCGTADIWSTKRKSYLGVTVHWIDANTLERKSSVLCVRRFESPHDASRIADLLSSIYDEFDISEKVICTVTDNASNFVKAFKDFGVSMDAFIAAMAAKKNERNDTNAYNEHSFEADSSFEFNFPEDEEANRSGIDFIEIEESLLSDHYRCGSHTFCLLASKDAKNAFENEQFETQHKSAFDKVNELYKNTNRPKSSEIITNILKCSLILPVATRWNSMFDSVEQILSFELKVLNAVMLELDLPQFTQEDYDFLQEYLQVMEPIATSIDNLQSTNSYYAIFLPTLHSVKYALQELEKSNLKYCEPLLHSVKAGFEKRFKRFFNRHDDHCIAATIASVTHPHFKLRWLHNKYQTKSYVDHVRELLITKATEISSQSVMESSQNIVEENVNRGEFRLPVHSILFQFLVRSFLNHIIFFV